MQFHNILLTFIFGTLAFALEKAEIESDGEQYPWKVPKVPHMAAPPHHAQSAIRPLPKATAIKADVIKKVIDKQESKKSQPESKPKASAPMHSHSVHHQESKDNGAVSHSKPHLRAAEHVSGNANKVQKEEDSARKSTEPVPAHFSAGKVNKHKVSHIVTASANSAEEMDVSKAERAALDIAAASMPSKTQSLALEGKTPETAGGPSLMRREVAAADKEASPASAFEDEKEREKNLQNMILDAQSNLIHLNALVAAEKEQQEKLREAALEQKMNERLNPGAPASSPNLNGTAICQGRNWTPRQCWLIGCCKYTPTTVLSTGVTVPGQCLSAVGVDACDTGSLVTGPLMCENHGFDKAACNLVGCCQFVNGNCQSAVGNNYCALTQTYDFSSAAASASPGGGIGKDGIADMTAVFHYDNQDTVGYGSWRRL